MKHRPCSIVRNSILPLFQIHRAIEDFLVACAWLSTMPMVVHWLVGWFLDWLNSCLVSFGCNIVFRAFCITASATTFAVHPAYNIEPIPNDKVFITYPPRCMYVHTRPTLNCLSVGISLRWNRIRSKSYPLYGNLDLRNYYESEWMRRVSTCLKQRFPLYWHSWAKSSFFSLYKKKPRQMHVYKEVLVIIFFITRKHWSFLH